MKTIEDLGDLAGQRVLVRSDLNVPIKGEVIGTFRSERTSTR